MRKIKEVLRLRHEAGLGWPLPEGLSEDALEDKLFPWAPDLGGRRKEPVWAEVHEELRKKGVTRRLLWLEYAEGQANTYSYPQFCERFNRWAKVLHPTMRLMHKAGEKLFVDYAGLPMFYQDRTTGEVHEVSVFVATMGASSATFTEAHASQALPWWIGGHVHAFEYFGGVAAAVVPDNTKTGVTSACFYEPDLNPTYQDMAEHYGTAVLPTRVRHPRDNCYAERMARRLKAMGLPNYSRGFEVALYQEAGVPFFFKQWGGTNKKKRGGCLRAACGTRCLRRFRVRG